MINGKGQPLALTNARADDWLVGGGEMGKLVRSMDWSRTPLGPIDTWPQSLRTTVSLCLASNFPISLAWGPKHVQIYNDGYWPICGGKHPQSMGQDFSECWASPWPVIGSAFERALAGETSYLEDQRMFLDRNGYLEETFFTFSFSPIRDETGGVGGLFHPVTETTGKMISERRTRALRDLAARTGKAQSNEEVFALAAQTLADYAFDLPFALFYVVDDLANKARLTAHIGLMPETPASPILVDLDLSERRAWPFAEVVRSKQLQQIDDLDTRFSPFVCGPYPESPKIALALPVIPPGCEQPTGIVIAGVSSRLPLTEGYRAFYDLLAAAVTTSVANARAYEEERKRAEALAEIDRAKTAFFSNVSHEFRTPLTLMLGPLEDELAERASPLPPARRERLETAHRNSLRLLKLVNTLLDFSRIEAGRVEANYEPTDLAAYTRELASVFRSAIEKANLTLMVDCPPLPESIYIDREMWEKIVLNLLSNAFKHTFEGSIRVILRWCDDHVELAVADSGIGISKAELPRLFERFHRVKGAKSRTHEGTGIGLALVQELMSLHGGTVGVESQEGKGTTFTVIVKAGRAHLPAERIGGERTLASTASRTAAYVEEALRWLPDGSQTAGDLPSAVLAAPASNGRQAHVLLADDNADLRAYVAGLLRPHYHVEAVADGALALEAVHKRKPDLIVSDVMMPNLDGLGLLHKLREDTQTQTIPVILLSARAGEESAVEGLKAGADDYLAKPFSAQELLARVRTHLELAQVRGKWALELEQTNKELEAFSYSVSHDLRAPLRHISGFANLLQNDASIQVSKTGSRYLKMIADSSKQMGCLIDGLLSFSRMGRVDVLKTTVDLTPIVQEVLRDAKLDAQGRDITWDIGLLPKVQGDSTMLRQVLANLIGNAVKYTRKCTQAKIAVGCQSQNDDELIFFVRDNGAGFDMKYASKLFGVFQRLHSSDDFEGTGIGLANVRRIIQRHGGKTWAEGAVNQGAAFFFSLPHQ
jgi:signal transduction histidine kinase